MFALGYEDFNWLYTLCISPEWLPLSATPLPFPRRASSSSHHARKPPASRMATCLAVVGVARRPAGTRGEQHRLQPRGVVRHVAVAGHGVPAYLDVPVADRGVGAPDPRGGPPQRLREVTVRGGIVVDLVLHPPCGSGGRTNRTGHAASVIVAIARKTGVGNDTTDDKTRRRNSRDRTLSVAGSPSPPQLTARFFPYAPLSGSW